MDIVDEAYLPACLDMQLDILFISFPGDEKSMVAAWQREGFVGGEHVGGSALFEQKGRAAHVAKNI